MPVRLSRGRSRSPRATPGCGGAVSLELLAVLPAFIVLVLGIMEMGSLFHYLLLADLASNEATRAIAVGHTVAGATALAQRDLSSVPGSDPLILSEYRESAGGVWGAWQTVTDAEGTNDAPPQSQVRVTVIYQHHLLAPQLFPGLADVEGMQTMEIQGTHVMNRE